MLHNLLLLLMVAVFLWDGWICGTPYAFATGVFGLVVFTLPREINFDKRANRLRMTPIKEVESLRQTRNTIEMTTLNNKRLNYSIRHRLFELNLTWSLDWQAEKFGLWLGKGLSVCR